MIILLLQLHCLPLATTDIRRFACTSGECCYKYKNNKKNYALPLGIPKNRAQFNNYKDSS